MKRLLTALALAAMLAGAVEAQPGGGRGRGAGPPPNGEGGPTAGDNGGQTMGFSDPARVIQAEIAVGQLAVQKGQWEALQRMGTKEAVLLVPQPVAAQAWLKAQRPPAQPARLDTHQVFLSCDGTTALTIGNWRRPDGTRGWYRAVWRRDPRKGNFQWLVAAAGSPALPGEEPDAIDAKVAQCQRRRGGGDGPHAPAAAVPVLDVRQPIPAVHEERSADGSLRWRWSERGLEGWMMAEGGEQQVLPAQ